MRDDISDEVLLNRIVSDNDQDRSECDAWWRDTSTEERMLVLTAIIRKYRDPVMQVVVRFAQLAFGEAAERAMQAKITSESGEGGGACP